MPSKNEGLLFCLRVGGGEFVCGGGALGLEFVEVVVRWTHPGVGALVRLLLEPG